MRENEPEAVLILEDLLQYWTLGHLDDEKDGSGFHCAETPLTIKPSSDSTASPGSGSEAELLSEAISGDLANLIMRLQVEPPPRSVEQTVPRVNQLRAASPRSPWTPTTHNYARAAAAAVPQGANSWKGSENRNDYLTPRESRNSAESVAALSSAGHSSDAAGAKVDDRRRAALGWPLSDDLDATDQFDALDALDVLHRVARLSKVLRLDYPWCGTGLKAYLQLIDQARQSILQLPRYGPSLLRLAALKDDSKLPLPIFKEAEAAVASSPLSIAIHADLLSKLPAAICGDSKGSVKRVISCLRGHPMWLNGDTSGCTKFMQRFHTTATRTPAAAGILPLKANVGGEADDMSGGLILQTNDDSGGTATYFYTNPNFMLEFLNRAEGQDAYQTITLANPEASINFSQTALILMEKSPQ